MDTKDVISVTEDGGREIRLERPLKTHGAPVTVLKLRAPKWTDYQILGGEIAIPSRTGDTILIVDDSEKIRGYVERLVGPDNEQWLPQLTLRDTVAAVEAVKSFFIEARSGLSARPSSSSSDGDQAISKT